MRPPRASWGSCMRAELRSAEQARELVGLIFQCFDLWRDPTTPKTWPLEPIGFLIKSAASGSRSVEQCEPQVSARWVR
jgi:hypothetical protein